jgi:tRNA (cmo5U34)-methyltransferase
MKVKKGFDKGAKDYDSARKQLIPCFDEFYGIALDVLPFQEEDTIKVLDLGAGTGLFSYLVSQRYPNAEFVLYDVSQAMLEEAKVRFSSCESKVEYVSKDYAAEPIEGQYDLIISALSVHHLTDVEKERLFNNIYSHLNHYGMFINSDQVLGDTPLIEQFYRNKWLKQVKEKGVTDSSLALALERMKEDKMSTLSQQLMWLKNAKFSEVNCWYKNYSFAIYSGRKLENM